MIKALAPIVLFVYNRPFETRLTLEALQNNILADKSILYVFADGLKENATSEDRIKITQVSEVVKSNRWCKEVHLIQSEKNKGLANSVIEGVTEIVNRHGKVIVLEDDIVTSPYFLKFLNDGLELYQNSANVYAINSYMFPIETKEVTSFLCPLATSTWGWGTWANRWSCFQKEPSNRKIIQNNLFIRSRFNFADYNYADMLDNTTSWGIRWYYSVFMHNGLGLFPTKSLSKNIGFGETATHTKGEFNQMEPIAKEIPVQVQLEMNCEYYDLLLKHFQNKHESHQTNREKRSLNKMLNIKRFSFKIINRIFNALDYSVSKNQPVDSRLAQDKFLNFGIDSDIKNIKIEVRKEIDKIFLELGSYCSVQGTFIFENSEGYIQIGDRTFIGGSTFICIDRIKIGNDVMISWGCTIVDNNAHSLKYSNRITDVSDWKRGLAENKVGFYKDWSDVKKAPVIIKDKVWIGFNSIILKGVTIGEGAVIGAGSVVTKDVAPWTIVAGNPARLLREMPVEER